MSQKIGPRTRHATGIPTTVASESPGSKLESGQLGQSTRRTETPHSTVGAAGCERQCQRTTCSGSPTTGALKIGG